MKTLNHAACVPFLVYIFFVLVPGHPVYAAGSDSGRVRQLVRHPPREYSTGPLWVWNDLLTEQEVRDTLRDLAQQKVRQVWVHPRPGLMTPYLSGDWFRLWKVALREAARLDMNVWIYDENSYPSGFGGGLVPEAMPESRGRGLAFVHTNRAPCWSTNFLRIYALQTNAAEDVTATLKGGAALLETNFLIVSEIRATNSPWNGNRPYVNLLSPGVTEKFLELTLEPYRREVGSQFGRRVPGVFTDEPNIQPVPDGWPWSEELAAEFEKRWGFSLLDQLVSLNRPVGDWRRIRYQYFQVLNDQFIEHWSRPYHDYCERYGLQWTGHYWDHDWPRCLHVPDNMAMYAWHQTPAIDCLMNQYEEQIDSQFGDVRMVRELASVANQLGLKRTLCETYGAGGWDLRFEDMKRIGDWLEVLGVNLIDQHLSYVTLRGARKRDHPQSFSYHEPWWPAYHVSADYFARLSAALAQGQQVNPVLVLEPTTTAWMYQGEEGQLRQLGKSFLELVTALERSQVEYDLGSEDILARHGAVGLSGLRVGRRCYRTVILPPLLETMNTKTLKLLRQFLAAGGTVLSGGPPPGRIDGALSEEARTLAASSRWQETTVDRIPASLPDRDFTIHRASGDPGILFHQRRQLGDGQLLFLVNTSLEFPAAGTFESGLSGVEQWNLRTGTAERYAFARTATGVRAEFKLEPSGSLLLFLANKPLKPARSGAPAPRLIEPEGPPAIRRVADNVLVLDYVDVSAGGEAKTNVYFYQANQFIWQKHGRDANPWDSAVQFGNELITNKFPADSGFVAQYRFVIAEQVPTNLTLVLERPDLYTITCNQRPLKASRREWWLDKSFGRLNIAGAARVGQNVISIQAAPFTMFHELEPAYVLGNFVLNPVEHGFVIAPERAMTLGKRQGKAREGWNCQGYPFYAQGVAYSERFELKDSPGRFLVELTDWYGSVAQVAVNGRFAGYIDAPPWECDVTRWMRAGGNQVEVTVVGTLKNTLGPHHGNPALGSAWPKRFQVGPNPGPPPGTNYSTVAYGMFKPFVLKQSSRYR